MNAPRLVASPQRAVFAARLANANNRENAIMLTVHSAQPKRSGEIGFYLAFGATYPLFLAAEMFQRRSARWSIDDASQPKARRSVFATARESTLIAISYALMARTTLQIFARQNRTERLS
jgi:hypothetical protein